MLGRGKKRARVLPPFYAEDEDKRTKWRGDRKVAVRRGSSLKSLFHFFLDFSRPSPPIASAVDWDWSSPELDTFANYGAVAAGAAEEGALLATECVVRPLAGGPSFPFFHSSRQGTGAVDAHWRLGGRRGLPEERFWLLLRSAAAGNHLLFFKTTGASATVIFLGLSCAWSPLTTSLLQR